MTIIYLFFFFFNFSRQLFLRTNPPVNLTITSPHLSIVRCTYDRNTLPPLSLTVLFKMLKVIRRQENNKMCKLWIPLQSSLELSLSRWGLGARNKRPALVLALRFCLPLACGQLKMFFLTSNETSPFVCYRGLKIFFQRERASPTAAGSFRFLYTDYFCMRLEPKKLNQGVLIFFPRSAFFIFLCNYF